MYRGHEPHRTIELINRVAQIEAKRCGGIIYLIVCKDMRMRIQKEF